MSNVLGLWKRQARAQTPNLSGDTFAHGNEWDKNVQKTNLQTIPSQLWGDTSQGFFLLLLLKCMRENAYACVTVQKSRMLCVRLGTQVRGSRQGMNGKLVPPNDSAEAPLVWDICDQPAKSTYILFTTCTGTTSQQPSIIKTMEEKGSQISLLFDKWRNLNWIYSFLKVTQGCVLEAIKE